MKNTIFLKMVVLILVIAVMVTIIPLYIMQHFSNWEILIALNAALIFPISYFGIKHIVKDLERPYTS